MAVDVLTEIMIKAARDRVADYSGDPTNAPQWYVKINSVEWLTPEVVRVGSKVAFVARFLGRDLRYTYEIVEYSPSVRLVMRTAQGPFPMETTYTWVPEGDDATRMTLRNRGAPEGFSRVAAPFMTLAMRRANRQDLQRLKTILESA